MAFFYETPDSLSGSLTGTDQDLTREWYCSGVEDYDAVMALALASNPAVFRGLLRKNIKRRPLGFDNWLVTVEYGVGDQTSQTSQSGQGGEGSSSPPTPDTTEITPDVYSFRIGADRVHITQSLETRYRRTAADGANPGVGSAPDEGGAIGVTDDGVQGCEKVVGHMSWAKTVRRASLTLAFVRTVSNMVGKTNSAPFYGFPAGSLMYMGCEPSTVEVSFPDGPVTVWSLTHQFDHFENRINLSAGGITFPEKRGHDYVWFRYAPSTDGNVRTQEPIAGYVERVADEANFELLEIGR